MIFIDTGAFLARVLKRDGRHAAAMSAWPRLTRERRFTSSLVLVELFTLLERRIGAGHTREVGAGIYADTQLKILRPTQDQELAALDLVVKYADQRIGFVDCVSFVVMREVGIKQAFTFDRHFATTGFQLWPHG